MERRVSSLSQGQRLLAAIMITDAVGFSTRMSTDEECTLRLIDRDLTLIGDICREFGGTVLKSTGDGLLIYFLSAVEAVSCGLEMQRRLVDLAEGLEPNQYLDHRIGVHLGDILVSEQDVMGNGVNITARLQTYAKPRGLCVSRTIYDVVKARLNLHATFLGPLHLKNIEEPVPAYQLALHAEDTEPGPQGSEDHTCTLPMTTEALLANALRNLSTHTHSLRIKKLVFASYQQAWENDPTVLEQFDLRSLLLSLRDRCPTLADFEDQLQRVVAGLNRQDLYREVAETIVRQLQPWYGRSLFQNPEATPEGFTQLTVRSVEERCQAIADQFDQSPEALRLRKLLHCLCHGGWENDPNRLLNETYLPGLIQQTLTIAPKPQDLRYRLSRIVKHLNRRQQYTRLANQIMVGFQPLYQNQPEALAEATALVESTVMAESTVLAEPSGPSSPSSPSAEVYTTLASSGYDQPADLTTLHGTLSNPLVGGSELGGPRRDRSSLFDLRGDIIQYANPLRAKILLYSCLYGPFGYTTQDWSSLSRRTLDDLLQETFEYCPTYSDLDSKLSIIAHCLGQVGDGGQVAMAIAQAMRAYYPQDPNSLLEPAEAVAPGQPTHPEAVSESSNPGDRPAVAVRVSARSSA
ncbi:adenylate/guanylate cyclase domain-containing protein [Leptolyngbya sp. CCNP1308]|uniref:adenylate/guanylate cyclase domain-containing protein n=1 Tax=Leptolyngbya sp. CCNP1308 TaxID=3110255 RepID=UPI002B1F5201|nr:adenylate/guanylate cyclase domain-containing protein [Leptolyngbya sp. CCNP1308]MEA5451542.1 adenylate/guanylate cyclase domain-containing protein [Leptolyngbya sp. CCNP1308]